MTIILTLVVGFVGVLFEGELKLWLKTGLIRAGQASLACIGWCSITLHVKCCFSFAYFFVYFLACERDFLHFFYSFLFQWMWLYLYGMVGANGNMLRENDERSLLHNKVCSQWLSDDPLQYYNIFFTCRAYWIFSILFWSASALNMTMCFACSYFFTTRKLMCTFLCVYVNIVWYLMLYNWWWFNRLFLFDSLRVFIRAGCYFAYKLNHCSWSFCCTSLNPISLVHHETKIFRSWVSKFDVSTKILLLVYSNHGIITNWFCTKQKHQEAFILVDCLSYLFKC